jgi:hypothetical protein
MIKPVLAFQAQFGIIFWVLHTRRKSNLLTNKKPFFTAKNKALDLFI